MSRTKYIPSEFRRYGATAAYESVEPAADLPIYEEPADEQIPAFCRQCGEERSDLGMFGCLCETLPAPKAFAATFTRMRWRR